jgi:hypothetical protein
MVALVVDAVQIVAGLAAAGVSLDTLIEKLHAKGEHQHAQTLENLKAVSAPVEARDSTAADFTQNTLGR